ncbi:MAG: hypothetical protein Q7T25_13505 [Sideroxyarcus sp.]|nr:hypothetical protein [Sideroxyarcus sp.]
MAMRRQISVDTGLQLRISTDGVKMWIVRYSILGHQRAYRLPKPYGPVTDAGHLSLADARLEVAAIRALARSVDKEVTNGEYSIFFSADNSSNTPKTLIPNGDIVKLTLFFRNALIAVLLLCSTSAIASMFEELSELKKICDAKLLNELQCKAREVSILAKYDLPAEKEWFCNYGGESTPPSTFTQVSQVNYSESASASSIVKEILDIAGLVPNFIVRPASVSNASASTRSGERFVEYNPAFIAQLKMGTKSNWAVYSVMAHELGHHLQGHTLQPGGSRPSIELEADEYSGFILAKLGATLAESQTAMKTFGSNSASGTHPPTEARLQAIKTGWGRGSAATAPTSSPSPPTQPIPAPSIPTHPVVLPQPSSNYTDSCVVSGEPVVINSSGAVLSRVRGYMQVAQKVPSMHPSCRFDMIGNSGRYCVAQNGAVFFGGPMPVGQCQPCIGSVCN